MVDGVVDVVDVVDDDVVNVSDATVGFFLASAIRVMLFRRIASRRKRERWRKEKEDFCGNSEYV